MVIDDYAIPYLDDNKPIPRFLMYMLAIKIHNACPIPGIIRTAVCPCKKNQNVSGKIDFCHNGDSNEQLIKKYLLNDG
mgnify:CR=1 FL=1|tara:strand:+ start:2158 stop:2391 length:234 start_codon:yes stop_codon:yes gene_type:complete